jgi:hypothetical protein
VARAGCAGAGWRAPPPAGTRTSARDKIRELVLYSISAEYFSVRQHLGLNIGQAVGGCRISPIRL